MARIELRDAVIRLKDGLQGTANLAEMTPGATDTDADIDTVSLNTTDTRKVPIGARFTMSTAGLTTVFTVTGRVLSTGADEVQSLSASGATAGTFDLTFNLWNQDPVLVSGLSFDADPATIQTAIDSALSTAISTYAPGDVTVAGAGTADLNPTTFTYDGTSVANQNQGDMVVDGASLTGGGSEVVTTTTEGEFVDQTNNITFTPAWGTPTPAMNDTLNFQSNQLDIKIGEGNLTYTEAKEYEYLLDRGSIDTVKEGDDQPLEVNIDFVYEFVTTGTGEQTTPVDALKGINGADEWVSSSDDLCEPYCVDVEIDHNPECGETEGEQTIFPDYRYDSLEFDLSEATISTTGRCNVTEAVVSRSPLVT